MDMAETLNHFARLRTVPDSKPGRPCGHSEVNLSNESLLIAWPLKGHPTFTCFFHWRLSPVGWPDSSASTPESGPTGTSTRTHRHQHSALAGPNRGLARQQFHQPVLRCYSGREAHVAVSPRFLETTGYHFKDE
jgi:hypothetical protein